MRLEGLKYRNRQEINQAKVERQHRWINTWFLKGGHTSVLQVQATQRGSGREWLGIRHQMVEPR